MYSDIVKDHAINPRNRREMMNPDLTGEGKYPRCGDKMKLFLRLKGESIVEASFTASSCGPAVAAASLATTLVQGLTLAEARDALVHQLPQLLTDLPTSKRHAILLIFECLAEILEHNSHKKT